MSMDAEESLLLKVIHQIEVLRQSLTRTGRFVSLGIGATIGFSGEIW